MSHPADKLTKDNAADPRFAFPRTFTPTRCQVTPQDFDFTTGDRTTGGKEAEQRLTTARTACGGCPVAAQCLLWALVHKSATRVGIWAATTPRERTGLRNRLAARLGPDWVDVLAAQDQARRQRAAARHDPLAFKQTHIVGLDSEIKGPMSSPRSLTPAHQQHNSNRLMADAHSAHPAKKLAQAS